MAVDTRKVRVEEQLKIKIGEAKSLVGRSNGGAASASRDVYCTVALDQEEIYRTSTMERTLNPFFGEEFQFEIPRKFRYLSVYVFDRDRHLKQDKVIGKVAIKREELHSYNHKDHWFAIRPVDADSEVQGMVHVEVSFEETNGSVKRKSDFDNESKAKATEIRDSHSELTNRTKCDKDKDIGTNGVRIEEQHRSASDCFRISRTDNRTNNRKNENHDCTKENVYSKLVSSTSTNNSDRDSDNFSRTESLRSNPTIRKNNTVGKKSSLSYSESLKSPHFFHKKTSNLTLPNPKSSTNTKVLSSNSTNSVQSFSDLPSVPQQSLPLPPKPVQLLSQTPKPISSQFYTASPFTVPSEPAPPIPTLLDSGSNSLTIVESVNPFKPNLKNRVTVRVVECVELTLKNGACDPYAVVTALYSNGKKTVKRTKVRKKTVSPSFDESFTFDLHTECDKDRDSNNAYTVCPLGESELCEVGLSLWHDAPGMGGAVFLGEVRIPLRGSQQQNAVNCNAWYYLQPRSSHSRPARSCATPPGTRLSSDNTLGSLRLKIHYTADHVFSEQTYDALKNLLMQSLNVQPITSSAVYLLGEIVPNKIDAAKPLVSLFTHHRQIVNIIRVLADHEISKLTDATTIFRGNTLVSKMMDEAMKLWGLPYLHRTLRSIVENIFNERKPCEIDPTRVKDSNTVHTNLENLKEYVEKVFVAITNSAVNCPAVLCQIFQHLRESACRHFPLNKEVRYSVVSGFIFLRFFAPAILGPRLFDLTNEQDVQTSRTLTLISKTIQSLGNLVSSRSAQQLSKEQYTSSLYKAFCTEKHVGAVKRFLEVISTTGPSRSESGTAAGHESSQNSHKSAELSEEDSVLLKEGMMTKRAQGRKRFGRKNFKERYFRLTTQNLTYAKAKGKPPLCTIPLTDILAVETLTEQSFKMKNMFQIVQAERALYVQTANCVELKEWVDLMNKVCHTNANRLQMYHPCAYISGQWLCCQNPNEHTSGCTAVSSSPTDIHMTLDPARDLQRLHSLIVTYIPRLQILIEGCECQNIVGADAALVGAVMDDPQSCLQTLVRLRGIGHQLDMHHSTHLRALARETRYGSRQAPIGDDNYLHLARSQDPSIGRDIYKKESIGFKFDYSTSRSSEISLHSMEANRINSFQSSAQEALRNVAVSLKQSVERDIDINDSNKGKIIEITLDSSNVQGTGEGQEKQNIIDYTSPLENSNLKAYNKSDKNEYSLINQRLSLKTEQSRDLINESEGQC